MLYYEAAAARLSLSVTWDSPSQSYCLSCSRFVVFPLPLLLLFGALIRDTTCVGFRAQDAVGSVFPTHLMWPVSAVQTSAWPWPTFRLWPTKRCWERPGAGVSPAEVVAFVESNQFIAGEPTPPLPFVSLLWLMSFPSGWPPPHNLPASIKKESLPIPLAFTSTLLFLLNTHENTQPWLNCSLFLF